MESRRESIGSRAGDNPILRTLRPILDPELRRIAAFNLLQTTIAPHETARALENVCQRAEAGCSTSRAILTSLVEALRSPSLGERIREFRTAARAEGMVLLERLLRSSERLDEKSKAGNLSSADSSMPTALPDYRTGRTLTLGERKSMARRPNREALGRLLRDPHPDVVRVLLGGRHLTEDDVLALVTRRPNVAKVLREVAESSWSRRARIRLALVLHPDLEEELAAPLLALLLVPELRRVQEAPGVPTRVQKLAKEHLRRRVHPSKVDGGTN